MPAGGALGYLTVEPPRALSYGPPAIDSSWLANLSQKFQQGQEYARQRNLQTLFQPGTPGAAALEQAGVQPGSLFGVLAGAGGAETVGPFGQLMMRGQLYDQTAGNQPAQSGQPQVAQSGQPTSGRGQGLFDSIYQQESSSGRNTATSWAGARGPMQITPGTWKEFAKPGENIDNPDDNRTVGKRILDHYVEKYGDPARAAVAYYSGEGNVAPPGSSTPWRVNKQPINPRTGQPEPSVSQYVVSVLGRMRGGGQDQPTQVAQSDQLNPTDRAAVDRMYSASALAAPPGAPAGAAASQPGIAQPGVAQPGTGAPAPVEQPAGAIGTPPFMASSSTNGAGPANVSGRSAAAATMPQGGVPAGQQPPPPVSPETPGGRDVVPQGPSATTGQEVGGAGPPGYTRQAIANMRTAATTLEAEGGRLGAYGFPGETSQAKFKQAADLRSQADIREKYLNEREQKQFGVGIAGQETLQKARVERSAKTYAGINAQAQQFERDQKPLLDTSKGLLSDPDMFTGAGANLVLNLNRIRTQFGDAAAARAAQLQETLKKITAVSTLSDMNIQRDQLEEAGLQSGRLFRDQSAQITAAAPALENTKYGNRALVEIKSRMGELSTTVAQMARDYVRDQRHPYLDEGFDQKLADYMKSHPVFSKQEQTHPELLGAPYVPPQYVHKDGVSVNVQPFKEWAGKLGLNKGDAVRMPNGSIQGVP